MPGLCGRVDRAWQDATGVELEAMMGVMTHHDWYRHERHLDPSTGVSLGRVSLGRANDPPQPAVSVDGALVAFLDGEILEPQRHRQRWRRDGAGGQETGAELLLRGYEAMGRAFLSGVEGSFVGAILDARKRQLILLNDPFGMRTLYVAQANDRFLFASDLKALLLDERIDRRMNPRGLALFFSYGQFLGDETYFEAIRPLPAASWITYDLSTGAIQRDRYWRLGSGPDLCRASNAEIVDRIDRAFQQAMDRRVGGAQRLGLSLSGGLDARTMLGVIDHDHVDVTTICLGVEGSVDLGSAQQMANIVGCEHHSVVLNTDFLSSYERHLRDMVRLTDGHYLCQCIVMPTLPLYRELGIDVLLRGHAGELMHMDKAYAFSLDAEALSLTSDDGVEDWLFRHLQGFMTKALSAPLFAGDLEREAPSIARDALRAALDDGVEVNAPLQRLWRLFVNERLRRETSLSMMEFGSLMDIRLPYLDRELVELLVATPIALKRGETIQEKILQRRRPEFTRITNANTGAPMGASALRQKIATVKMKVLGKLGVKGYQPYERLGRWLKRELRPLVESLVLSERSLARGYFNPDTIRQAVAQHLASERNHTYLILSLMIFETMHRELLETPPIPKAITRPLQTYTP